MRTLRKTKTMSIAKPQAISGVSAGNENILTTIYPSLGAWRIGQWIGSLMNVIPVKLLGIRLSNLLFAPAAIPVVLPLYFAQKVVGNRYELTNTSLSKLSAMGSGRQATVDLADIGEVVVEQLAGQEFFKAADLCILSDGGEILMRLEGIPRAEVFRQTILKARDARTKVKESLTTIQARQSA